MATKPVTKNKKKKTSSRTRSHFLTAGTQVLLRTAVYAWSGRVTRTLCVEGVAFVELEDAAWVSDTGRYHEAVRGGPQSTEKSEIEVIDGRVLVQIASIGDVVELPSLPRATK